VKTVIIPACAAILAVAAFAGVELKSLLTDVTNARAQLHTVQEQFGKIRDQQGGVQANLVTLDKNWHALQSGSKLTAQQLSFIQNQSDTLQAATRNQENQIQNGAASLAGLSTRAVAIQEKNAENFKKLSDLEAESTSLRSQLVAASEVAARLKKENQFHRRLLEANVIETATLHSDDSSPSLQLPGPGNSTFSVRFETPKIDKTFVLTYVVGAHPQPVRVGQESKGQWYGLEGTEGLYEFAVDNLYHARAAPDFVTVRVRGTRALLLALENGSQD
jgi:hypothetical protein